MIRRMQFRRVLSRLAIVLVAEALMVAEVTHLVLRFDAPIGVLYAFCALVVALGVRQVLLARDEAPGGREGARRP